MALIAILHQILPRERRKSSASFGAVDIWLAWTLFGGVVSNLFFFDRPGIALVGGLAFGLFFLPYAFSRWLGRP
jgi:putative membrane protein